MVDDHSSLPVPARLRDWADGLPAFAGHEISSADLARPHLYTRAVALPAQVSALRAQVTDWSRQVGLPSLDQQDVVLATDEAVSNAVEHAYQHRPGALTLFAGLSRVDRAVRIIVADCGLWRPPAIESGFRGRGLAMMEKLAQVFRIEHTPHGTTVLLGWSLPH